MEMKPNDPNAEDIKSGRIKIAVSTPGEIKMHV